MTAEQRKALNGRDLDAEINEKLAMIAEGEKTLKTLEQEASRLSIIITQRKMDMDVLDMREEGFSAAVSMFGAHYRREIRRGEHEGKTVGQLLIKYLNRERNLANWPGWRFSLARWLTRPWIDESCQIYNQTTHRPTQIKENNNG